MFCVLSITDFAAQKQQDFKKHLSTFSCDSFPPQFIRRRQGIRLGNIWFCGIARECLHINTHKSSLDTLREKCANKRCNIGIMKKNVDISAQLCLVATLNTYFFSWVGFLHNEFIHTFSKRGFKTISVKLHSLRSQWIKEAFTRCAPLFK